jgi:2,4-dienoyl-CoA reductase (NADPH2)
MTPVPGRFPTLFSPVRIGTMTLRNRLVMSPMETLYATPDGLPSERTIAYYAARAAGGVGLITLGASAVDARHTEVPNSLHFASDAVVAAHRTLTDAVHAHGARIQPQLAHAGPDGLGPEMYHVEALGPSAIQSYLTGTTSRALAAAELPAIVDLFRAAAARVRAAGYDGIELHAAHGYMLLGSFLTPWRNARRDAYSAHRREGRIKAVVEVIHAIKAEVGRDFPLTLRISGYERVAGGRDSTDTPRLAPALVEAGVDAFHVSGGVIDRLVTQMVNGADDPDALNVAAAAAVKRAVAVPVIAVGRIHDPALAERILCAGSADLIAMGRPLLADAALPAKARAGRVAEIRRCISCQNCIDAMETRFAMDCAVNPRTGRERELAAPPAARVKRVVIVGGGPGGLEAARVAAARGHDVTLYERARALGGTLTLAATVHPENQPFLDYLLHAVRRRGVTTRLGTMLTADDVVALAPDAVIVATGGRLVVPAIAGAELPHVLTGPRLRALVGSGGPAAAARSSWPGIAARVLAPAARWLTPPLLRTAARVWMPIGRRVTVIGADLAALELAEFLAAQGRAVGLLEPGEQIAPEVGAKRRAEHMHRLDRAGVPVNTGVVIERITPAGVVVRRAAGDAHLIGADSVILAGTLEPDTTLADALRGRVPELHTVGDCTGLGLIHKATLEGARAACAL